MSKRADEKKKLLTILKILETETDENHRISTEQIIERLNGCGIEAERKSVYRDLECLTDSGYDIVRGRNGSALDSRLFEQAELKLLVDAVQASKFISEKKSRDIIKKLSTLTSRHGAKELDRGVYVSERVKSSEKTTLYTIDALHSAMNSNHSVTFKYWEWLPTKEKKPKHGGKIYEISPWGLLWDDEYYYLLGYDSDFGGIKHFRVDKIMNLTETDEKRKGYSEFSRLDLGSYSKKVFGMFNGKEDTVVLLCDNSLAGVIFDRFGTGMTVFPEADGKFSVAVQVKVSRAFLSWVVQFGAGMTVTSPEYVKDMMTELISEVGGNYGK